MKPLNLDNSPCTAISSNCVIWQGPNLDCIKLCTGDTISDVVAKLASELCLIMDQLKVSNYDLTCFNLINCKPDTFEALLQFLIEQVCALNDIQNTQSSTSNTTKESTLVTVAPCFIVNGITVMPLSDYVIAIGNKICSLIEQIDFINSQITDILNRLYILENAPTPTFVIPSFTLDCQIGTLTGTQFINTILQEFINNVWCDFYTTTGTTSELSNAVQSICILDTDLQLTTGTPFSTNPNWIQSADYDTVADAINNLWVALCDVYTAVGSISFTGDTTNSIDVNVTAGVISATINDTGWVDLLGFSYYASGVNKPQCRRIGNAIHFRGNVVVPLDDPASPGNVVSYTSTSYNSVPSGLVFTGGGGVVTNVNGSITFNNNASVIPSSVIDTATNFDNTYGLGYIIAARQIDLNVTYGTALSAVLNVTITNDKKLLVSVLKDLEITNTRGSSVNLGTSPLRFITSNVRVGEYVPDYIAAASDIHNAPSNANFPLVSNTKNVTWPFSCDAGEEDQIGGFIFKLDNLIAYLDPCTSDIKPTVCP